MIRFRRMTSVALVELLSLNKLHSKLLNELIKFDDKVRKMSISVGEVGNSGERNQSQI